MTLLRLENLSMGYENRTLLSKIDLSFEEGRVACLMGPSGCGKSSLLRALNRMNDDEPGYYRKGRILLHEREIQDAFPAADLLRRKIGMVFQKPVMFPMSIFQNVIFGVKRLKTENRSNFENIVRIGLQAVNLWDEVKDRLDEKAENLSQGQKQRLTIARALVLKPEILLLDEPTSALDEKSARLIEDLILKLKNETTPILVTHDRKQAARIADVIYNFDEGRIKTTAPTAPPENTEVPATG